MEEKDMDWRSIDGRAVVLSSILVDDKGLAFGIVFCLHWVRGLTEE